jgi:type I restriction enzyme S subunit
MAVKYQAYPEYQDTGVEWLGDIPEHWDVKKIKFFASVQPSNVDKNTKEGEHPVNLCNYTDVYYNDNVDESLEYMAATATDEQIEKFTLKAGDTIITKDSEDPADIAIPTYVPNDLPGVVCGYHLAMIRPFDSTYGSFIKRVFESGYARAYFCTRSNGLTRYGLGAYPLSNVFYPRPPKVEALQIANFLDHETAKIDTLIDKQQQLIKLVKEKRQAVISHAVTKGLNPDALMKDSGVEWLGEVPEHWMKIKAKRLFKFEKRQGYEGLTVLSVYRDHGVIVKSSRDDNFNKTPDNLSTYQLVKEGDLVINKMKAWQGSMGISDFEGITSPDYAVYSPLHMNEDSYLHFWFRAGHMPDVYRNISTGIRPSQWRLDLEEFEHLNVFMPPQKERSAIVERIKEVEGRYLKLIGLAETQITLLQERRTALISTVVTGKIDVRNWQPAQIEIPMEASA